jgi:hypothetical protein
VRLGSVALSEVEEIRISRVNNGHDTENEERDIKTQVRIYPAIQNIAHAPDTEKLSGSSTKSNVGASKVVDSGLGEHGIVLKLRLAQRRAVSSNQHEFG